MKKIILASKSPRRKELLEKCGFLFSIDAADIDETIDERASMIAEVKRLAFEKASTVLCRHPQSIVIGSDTIVTIDGKVLGKPKTKEEAILMLRTLSGRTHQVITSLAIVSDCKKYVDVVISDVTFTELSEEEIIDYVASGEPMDKAGAYGIQGKAAKFIQEIHGDFYSIMGLPIQKVYHAMKHFEY